MDILKLQKSIVDNLMYRPTPSVLFSRLSLQICCLIPLPSYLRPATIPCEKSPIWDWHSDWMLLISQQCQRLCIVPEGKVHKPYMREVVWWPFLQRSENPTLHVHCVSKKGTLTLSIVTLKRINGFWRFFAQVFLTQLAINGSSFHLVPTFTIHVYYRPLRR